MPKEMISHCPRVEFLDDKGLADIGVMWGDKEIGSKRVRLHLQGGTFRGVGPAGSIVFAPDRPEDIGLNPGDTVGPVDVYLDRDEVNRMIRVLRRARDQVFGRDE